MGTAIWHLLVHIMGVDYQTAYGHWEWYSFWSGFGSLALISSVAGIPLVLFRKFECEMAWCIRIARHDWLDPERGVHHHLCRKHHPDHSGRMLRRHDIQRKLGLYLGKQPGKG